MLAAKIKIKNKDRLLKFLITLKFNKYESIYLKDDIIYIRLDYDTNKQDLSSMYDLESLPLIGEMLELKCGIFGSEDKSSDLVEKYDHEEIVADTPQPEGSTEDITVEESQPKEDINKEPHSEEVSNEENPNNIISNLLHLPPDKMIEELLIYLGLNTRRQVSPRVKNLIKNNLNYYKKNYGKPTWSALEKVSTFNYYDRTVLIQACKEKGLKALDVIIIILKYYSDNWPESEFPTTPEAGEKTEDHEEKESKPNPKETIKTLFKESGDANQLLENFLNYLDLNQKSEDNELFVERFKNLIKKYHSFSYVPTWLELQGKSTFTPADIIKFYKACEDKNWRDRALEIIGILSKYYYKYQKEFETPVNDHLFEIKPGADIDKINSLEESLRSLCKDDEIGDQVIAAINKIGFLEDELSIKAYNYAIAFFKNGETKPGRFYDKARVFWSEVGTRIRCLVYHYPEGEAIISSVGFFTTIKKFISN